MCQIIKTKKLEFQSHFEDGSKYRFFRSPFFLLFHSLFPFSFSFSPFRKLKKKKTNQHQTSSQNIELMYLANDFVYAARAVGKLIISEICLPYDQKMIKPITLGGRAGLHYKKNNYSFKKKRVYLDTNS